MILVAERWREPAITHVSIYIDLFFSIAYHLHPLHESITGGLQGHGNGESFSYSARLPSHFRSDL